MPDTAQSNEEFLTKQVAEVMQENIKLTGRVVVLEERLRVNDNALAKCIAQIATHKHAASGEAVIPLAF